MPALKPFPHRWWYWPPERVTDPGKPRVMLSTDEYCNKTLFLKCPHFGAIIIRYWPGPIRTEACGSCIKKYGPWCNNCVSCHRGPRCHPKIDSCPCGWDRQVDDCPMCGGDYCTTCEPNPRETCPHKEDEQ